MEAILMILVGIALVFLFSLILPLFGLSGIM